MDYTHECFKLVSSNSYKHLFGLILLGQSLTTAPVVGLYVTMKPDRKHKTSTRTVVLKHFTVAKLDRWWWHVAAEKLPEVATSEHINCNKVKQFDTAMSITKRVRKL